MLIVKGFKNRTRPRDLVDDKQLALNMEQNPAPLPAEIRMGSRFITVRWMLKNKAALQAAVVNPEWLAEDTDLRDTVYPDTCLQMEMFTSLLRPLWKLMRRAHTDGPGYVMWVYHDMLQFQVPVENRAPSQKMKFSASDLKYLRTCVIDRWKGSAPTCVLYSIPLQSSVARHSELAVFRTAEGSPHCSACFC